MVDEKFHFEINSFEEFIIFLAVIKNIDLSNEDDLAMLTAKIQRARGSHGVESTGGNKMKTLVQ